MAMTIVGGLELVGGIAIVSREDRRLEVFRMAADRKLYHRWQTKPNNGWSNWEPLGSPSRVGFGSPVAVSIMTGRNGNLEIFAMGGDGQLYHRLQHNYRWLDWSAFESLPKGFGSPATVSIVTNEDGHLEIFTMGGDGRLYHKWQQTWNSWSGWELLG